MRWMMVTILLIVSACSSHVTHELPQTSNSDPIWQLNDGKWDFNENNLTSASVTP